MDLDALSLWQGLMGRQIGSSKEFHRIETCLVRHDHSCGKYLGVSKSCFVACPSTEDVETTLELVKEKLTKLGVEPVVAIKERAYGQDIFCTKICGRIIESRFCLVILDDAITTTAKGEVVSVPNPNVYYEYGLMTALNKHVIPLQKNGQELAFNIQSHDTIKYTPRNLGSELDLAFKEAMRLSQSGESVEPGDAPSPQLIDKCMEIAGFRRKESNWFFYSELRDTVFRGYSSADPVMYVFLTVLDREDDVGVVVTDMQVIIKRLESKMLSLDKEKSAIMERLASLEAAESQATQMRVRPLSSTRLPSDIRRLTEEQSEAENRAALLRTSCFAAIVMPPAHGLEDRLEDQYGNLVAADFKPKLFLGDKKGVLIGESQVEFKEFAG